MYRFNQKRLVQNLGESHRHFLQDDLDLNPHRIRDSAIRAYNRFMELESDVYHWTDKHILKANYAINRYFHISSRDRRVRTERGGIPPHVRFMQSHSLSLNLDIMPDGLHGNADFMKSFVLAYRRVSRKSERNQQKHPTSTCPYRTSTSVTIRTYRSISFNSSKGGNQS